ncbi:uncharacterized protein METZ01_LOCUS89854 [marine metagenome]|uniref:Uncharacterized protein n=1 Tax=marine metagenome TaxID=408172 RepID=A0A381V9K6_9ZZZZ
MREEHTTGQTKAAQDQISKQAQISNTLRAQVIGHWRLITAVSARQTDSGAYIPRSNPET